MPITPYTRPQDTITQILRNTPATTAARRNALVIGPQYLLALNDGRELAKHAFDTDGATLPYELSADGVVSALDTDAYAVDQAGVKFYGEGLVAVISDTISADFVSGSDRKLRSTSGNIAGGSLATELDGRAVRVGDLVEVAVTVDGTDYVYSDRRVTALLYAVTPSSVGSPAGTTGLVSSVTGTYKGALNRTLIVKKTDATHVTVYDSTGATAASDPIAQGGTITLFNVAVNVASNISAASVGATCTIALTAEAEGTNVNGVVLDRSVKPAGWANESATLVVLQSYTGVLDNTNVSDGSPLIEDISDTVVSYVGAVGLPPSVTGISSFVEFRDAVGEIMVTYKAAYIPSETEGPIAIVGASYITSQLGEINDENWLARGAFEAINGSQGATVYALRTAGDTVEAFSAALNKIRSTDIYYALAPMTDSLDVAILVKDHCEEMSNKYNMNFRRCYIGTDSPGQYTKWGALSDGSSIVASLVSGGTTGLVTIGDGFSAYSFVSDAAVGDTILFPLNGGTATITAILNASEAEVATTEASAAGIGIQLIRKDTADNVVSYVSERSAALASRRCVNVWCDSPSDGSGIVPMKFVAAEIAGLRCALLPQQGLTMTELSSITSAPSMYNRFTPAQLDMIASYGTLIATQEVDGGPVFVRHQLTTDTTHGALAYEDNVGVIVDAFSLTEKDTFRGYRGRRNVTAATINEIRVKLKQIAIDATQADFADADYGPMIIRFFDANGKEGEVTVTVDGDLADHIATYVKLRVPLPLNGINHYVDVETSVDL